MLVPSMLNMADVMADSGYTEEDVFDCGISGQIIFLVVVPLIGACRVPVEALSHFMAGADDYAAEGMPEHWSGALSGKWTIKRDRLRILPQSWEAFSDNCYKLAEALDAASEPKEADAPAAKVEAVKPGITKGAVINAFEGLHLDRNGWNNALSDVPNWIEPCRVMRGRKGDKTASATWNPVLIAVALIDKEITPRKLDAVFVRLSDWADEWREVSALFRD